MSEWYYIDTKKHAKECPAAEHGEQEGTLSCFHLVT